MTFLDRLFGIWRSDPPVVLRTRSVHGLFLRKPLDLIGLKDGDVVRSGVLRPWRVVTWWDVDTIVEVEKAGESSEEIQI